ncbi:MAG: hypothetical protein WCC21_12705 [Candidatus Acidiferrales bacterium]
MTKAEPLPECSLSKTNTKCVLIVDRSNPVAPPTVQMYSGETVTVVVENPNPFERYFLDYQSGQATLKPDVASSLIQGLLPALGKLQVLSTEGYTPSGKAAAPLGPCQIGKIRNLPATLKDVGKVFPQFQGCMGYLANQAIYIYQQLEPFVAPDSLTPFEVDKKTDTLEHVQTLIANFQVDELTFSNSVSAISKAYPPAAGDPDSEKVEELGGMQKVADQILADLAGYNQRITDLRSINNGTQPCKNLVDVRKDKKIVLSAECVSITSRVDTPEVYHGMVTRTITYALNSYNLVANPQEASPDPSKKKLVATVPINFADAPKATGSSLRWEASAGAFFSTLPIRSFSAAPIFTNGVITDKKIVENTIHPTVVPFAAVNYRLTHDLSWTNWKSNFYLTGAVGINPNTVSADFATGISYSYRALMLSALCHFGHEVRLTQGLTVGESLGPGFNGSIPTQTFWTEAFAFGVSIRIPSLTGR